MRDHSMKILISAHDRKLQVLIKGATSLFNLNINEINSHSALSINSSINVVILQCANVSVQFTRRTLFEMAHYVSI